MFKRKIYNELLKWKNESDKGKAVLVEGARRIGKSTIVEEFAKNNYKSYILIDFSKVNDLIKDAFYNLLIHLDEFFMFLSSEFSTKLYPRESLFIFDEVQSFPRAREAIKHLVKDGRYDYIETGSLISIKENVRDILIPSEESKLTMYPMDFEEFTWALGEELMLPHIRKCFEDKTPLLEGIHRKAMLVFKQYMLVGGMPKAVSEFLSSRKQFAECEIEKREILNTYRDDIYKIDRSYKSKVLSVFDQLPSFLSQHEKRIRISSISPGNFAIKYEETFFWLSDSMMCNECFLCTNPNVELSLNEKRNYIKCYMGDTGLLITHALDENSVEGTNYHKQLLNGKLSINKGMFFENVVAQMLVANGHKLYFYTHYNAKKHRNDIEIDFLLTNGDKIKQKLIPIEVKSANSYKTESLNRFIKKFRKRIEKAYIIHPKNLSIREDGIICIPVYMTFCL